MGPGHPPRPLPPRYSAARRPRRRWRRDDDADRWGAASPPPPPRAAAAGGDAGRQANLGICRSPAAGWLARAPPPASRCSRRRCSCRPAGNTRGLLRYSFRHGQTACSRHAYRCDPYRHCAALLIAGPTEIIFFILCDTCHRQIGVPTFHYGIWKKWTRQLGW